MKEFDLRKATSVGTHIERGVYEMTCMTEPDPTWAFIDKGKHIHVWENGTLPTLFTVVDEWDWDEDGERYAVRAHYECRLCKDRVTPGYRPGTVAYAPGPLRRSADVVIDGLHFNASGAIESLKAGELARFRFPGGVVFEGRLNSVITDAALRQVRLNIQIVGL